MGTTFPTLINIAAFVLILLLLYWMQSKYFSFAKRVFSALGLGVLFGLAMHLLYGQGSINHGFAHFSHYPIKRKLFFG